MKVDLKKRGIAMSIIVAILIPLALGLMFFPPAHMELKGLPFGLLSLDKGAQQGPASVNLGDEFISKIESGDLGSSEEEGKKEGETEPSMADALSFKVFTSESELDKALEDNELYGAIVIPEDFSTKQLAAMMKSQAAVAATGGDMEAALAAKDPALAQASQSDQSAADEEVPAISVILDYAKSPLVATQLETNVSSLFSSLGVEASVDVINKGPAEDIESGNVFSGMFSQVMVIMPLIICALLGAIFSMLGFGFSEARKASERLKKLGLSLAVEIVASFIVAVMGFWMLCAIAGLPVDFWPYIGFTWICSFFLMVFFTGCASIRNRVAVAMGAIIILLGMTTGYLPFEALPGFWQDWVCPWAPQFYIGNGLREVVFAGESVWNQGTVACLVYAIVGAVLAIAGVLMPRKGGSDIEK